MTIARGSPEATPLLLGPVAPPGSVTHGPARAARPTGSDCHAAPAEGDPSAESSAGARQPAGSFSYSELDNDVERELLWRISCADRDAFRQLYLRYHRRLSRFLSRVTSRHEDVEDAINDALLIVWQRAGQFRNTSRVSTWIFSISYRCALKSIRRSAVPAAATALDVQGGAAVTEDTARETEDRQMLDLGLARLPIEQRLVLVLAYYLDYSCEEIAAIVECPVNTVKTRMFHARRKLRKFVSEAS